MIQCDSNLKITMDYGDWGVEIPFSITGDICPSDELVFIIAQRICEEPIIIKMGHTTAEGYYSVTLSKEESSLLNAGKYIWGLQQYRDTEFLNTIVNGSKLEVVKGVTKNE